MVLNTVGIVLATIQDSKLQILLQRHRDGCWGLPEQKITSESSLDDTALSLLEKAASKVSYFRQLYTLGKADRGKGQRTVTTFYICLTPKENILEQDNDKNKWFTVSKDVIEQTGSIRESLLSLTDGDHVISYRIEDKACENYIRKDSALLENSAGCLYEDHIKMINMAMDELQLHVISSGLIFNLLPAEFTLKQVQNVYEIISGTKKDTPNFRRDILKMLVPTGKTVKTYNREAELFSFNPLLQYLKGDL